MTGLISIIIPLALNEEQWLTLCADFYLLPANSQIIIVATNGANIDRNITALARQFPSLHWQVVYSDAGRAIQLNAGARAANNRFLWFLHADSLITAHNVDQLLAYLGSNHSQAQLFYFDLLFHDKASNWLKINEYGAKFRSNILGLPFGDQGFCLSKDAFSALGGYNEQAQSGEDHLLVWQAKHHGIKLILCPSALATSARKYQQQGWRQLTLKYQMLWPQQAWPQFTKLIKIKLGII